MELKDLRKKTKNELQKLLADKQNELQKVVTDIFQNKEKNTKKPNFLRKDIARVKTLINQKVSEENINLKKENKNE